MQRMQRMQRTNKTRNEIQQLEEDNQIMEERLRLLKEMMELEKQKKDAKLHWSSTQSKKTSQSKQVQLPANKSIINKSYDPPRAPQISKKYTQVSLTVKVVLTNTDADPVPPNIHYFLRIITPAPKNLSI